MPNFVKIGQSVAEILRFFHFFKMAAVAILDFLNREILLDIWVQTLESHQYVKFCQNRSIGCEDIKIFQDGVRPPSWICLGHNWTINSEYLGSLSLCKIW